MLVSVKKFLSPHSALPWRKVTFGIATFTFMKKSTVYLQFEKLEDSKRELLKQLAQLDETILHYKPSKEKWSIIQIIFHLNSSESGSVKYIGKKSLGGTAVPKSSLISSIKSYLLTSALRNFTWKKPAILPDPPEKLVTGDMMKQWDDTRIGMKQLLDAVPEEMLDRQIYRHPLGGRMNVKQALTFMQE